MALNAYRCSSLIGGGAGALDSLDGANLLDLYSAVVFTADTTYFYILDDNAGGAEGSPDKITPDSNAGTKRWILVGSIGVSGVLTLSNVGLHLLDTNASHDLIVKPGSNLTADRIWTITTGDAARTTTLKADSTLIGDLRNIWIPAGAMISLTTNGAIAGTNEYATNDIMRDYFAFDGATEEYVAFTIAMPEGWDRGTIKAKFYWAPGDAACTAGDTVEWELGGGASSDDDAIDAAIGTTQVISDTVLAGKDGDTHISGATPAITIGGTPALLDLIDFKGSRNVGGTDDMTEDAWLFGIMLQITIDQAVSAW